MNYLIKSFADIFKEIEPSSLKIKNTLSVPNDFYRQLLDYVLERGYLNEISERQRFLDFSGHPGEKPPRINWMRVDRLPVHPNEMKEYDLLLRWQGVLSTLHTWGHRLVFNLQRKNGETGLYLGTASLSREVSAMQAIEQFKEAASGSMPGIDLKPLTDSGDLQTFMANLIEYNSIGTITGLPSLKKDAKMGMLQTLDQLAFGIRNSKGIESDFSLIVIADPLNDKVITETIHRFRELGSQIHLGVKRSLNESEGVSESSTDGIKFGTMFGGIASSLLSSAFGPLGGIANAIFGGIGAAFDKDKNHGFSANQSVTTDYLDKFAEYAEKITDMHVERFLKGRNLGFWNTGIYVLGKSQRDINTVTGILRSIYSGDFTYIEPIRASLLNENSGAIDIVRRGELIPLANENYSIANALGEWNIFGKPYQYLSTPMNTEELSIATSLPRRDVPGLRFVKSSVRFANNPALTKGDTIALGRVVDTGVVQKNEYRIDPNALVRHAIVAGSTGSGKSNTCLAIISEIMGRDIPVMVIEPAKDDYVRWAFDYNEKVEANPDLTPEQKKNRKFEIYMPGLSSFEGVQLKSLKLNPFQPAAIKGAPVDLMTRVEQFTAILNASLPNADILPVIIDEALFKFMSDKAGKDFMNGDMKPLIDYPKLDEVTAVAKEVLKHRGYEEKITDNLNAALETRFMYLTRGKRGSILNVNNSTNYDSLFSRPTIINVSKIANSKDKALIMALLMLALYEYRISAYTFDKEYRKLAQANKLLHLTVIEELIIFL